MLLAKRIKAIRTYKGLSQQTIYERLGVNQSTYSGYENEAGNLKFITIIGIAEALECSIPFLTDIYSSIVDEHEWHKQFSAFNA
jgi:transcriptional regulator with XRE-family HTH domain